MRKSGKPSLMTMVVQQALKVSSAYYVREFSLPILPNSSKKPGLYGD
jgi:hypothetical protein